MELEDDGKVDFIFEQVQNVLQSLKQKIKDGSATNKGMKHKSFNTFNAKYYPLAIQYSVLPVLF